jgi:hypothetical protein
MQEDSEHTFRDEHASVVSREWQEDKCRSGGIPQACVIDGTVPKSTRLGVVEIV